MKEHRAEWKWDMKENGENKSQRQQLPPAQKNSRRFSFSSYRAFVILHFFFSPSRSYFPSQGTSTCSLLSFDVDVLSTLHARLSPSCSRTWSNTKRAMDMTSVMLLWCTLFADSTFIYRPGQNCCFSFGSKKTHVKIEEKKKDNINETYWKLTKECQDLFYSRGTTDILIIKRIKPAGKKRRFF